MDSQDFVNSQFPESQPGTQKDESDVKRMKQAFIDERAAPELLLYQDALLERLQSMIGHQVRR